MRNFIYALRQVFRLRISNLLKLLSLTLGITISGAFMLKVAYQRSYDDFHPDVDRINILYMHYNINGKDHGYQRQCLAPIAPELRAKMPNVIAATRFQAYDYNWYVKDNEPISLRIASVDSSFFDVFDIPVLSGDAKRILSTPEGMLISAETAEKLYPNGDHMGKQLLREGKTYTIQGVYANMPRNSHLMPMEGLIAGKYYDSWRGGDNSYTYFKTSDNVTEQQLTTTINELLALRFKESPSENMTIDFKVENIRYEFANNVKDINLILSLLAFVVILVAGFNFALLSISSLVTRAKEIGVHKVNGANGWGIFSLIIWESIIYVGLGLVLSALIMVNFKFQMESMLGLYKDVLVLQNIWAVVVVLVTMVIVSGVLPAIMFARIPVSQVFRRFKATKVRWEMSLLFIQFASTIFVLSFLGVIVGQYSTLMNYDLGYNYKNLIHTRLREMTEVDYSLITNELKRLSCVEDVTFSSDLIPNFGGGWGIQDVQTGEQLFSSSAVAIDSNYIDLHGMELLIGIPAPMKGNYADTTNITLETMVVNQEFIRRLGATSDPLCDFMTFDQVFHIVGVVRDFQTTSLKAEVYPLLMIWRTLKSPNCVVTVKLTALTEQNVKSVDGKLRELFPSRGIEVSSYSDTIAWMYKDTKQFRDGVVIASIVLLIISILGIWGYVANEIKRRASEIALRKIYGSTSKGVVMLILRKLLILLAISAIVATPLSYIVSQLWQADFKIKLPLYWWIFAGAVLIVMAVVVICVIIQTWRIARDNPSNSIKSE